MAILTQSQEFDLLLKQQQSSNFLNIITTANNSLQTPLYNSFNDPHIHAEIYINVIALANNIT